jgi:hypothetical protein
MYTHAALNRFFGEESQNDSSEISECFLHFLSDDGFPGCNEPSFVELLNKRNIYAQILLPTTWQEKNIFFPLTIHIN